MRTKKCSKCSEEFIPRRPSSLGKFCSCFCYHRSMIGRKLSTETLKRMENSRLGKKGKGGIPEINITGQRFGRLTAIRFVFKRNSSIYWLFQCDCGKIKTIRKGNVTCKIKNIKDCGCVKKENRKNSFLGKRNPNWRGGISPFLSQVRAIELYKQWRLQIIRRDNYTCQNCKKRGGHDLQVDHIKPFALILQENNIDSLEKAMNCDELWNTENGRVLCESCHKKTDTFTGRMYKILNKKELCLKNTN